MSDGPPAPCARSGPGIAGLGVGGAPCIANHPVLRVNVVRRSVGRKVQVATDLAEDEWSACHQYYACNLNP